MKRQIVGFHQDEECHCRTRHRHSRRRFALAVHGERLGSSERETPHTAEDLMRAALLIPVLCVVAACARPDFAESWPHRFTLSGGPQPGYAIKRVVEKREPAILLADDGSVCRTSIQRYAATPVGSWANCDWTLPTTDSTALEPRSRTLARE